MALYRQNRIRRTSIAEKIAAMLHNDIERFGDDAESIYRQHEEEIILWYLAGHHALTPRTTIAEYADMVESKKVPGLITLSTSIQKAFRDFARNLFTRRGWEKHTLEIDEAAVENIVATQTEDESDHRALLRYYATVHNIAETASLFDALLRPAGRRQIPSIHVARLRLMRARKARKTTA